MGPEQSPQDSGVPDPGETNAGRFLAVIVTERGDKIRVVTAYDLDAGQRRDYIERRTQGEWGQ